MKFINAKTLTREAKAAAAAELEQRQSAKNILAPDLLAARGKKATSAAAKLMTTLGGKPRAITTEDLKAFKQAIEKLQADRQHVGGILAAEVLAQSTAEDKDRAKGEVHHAVPFRYQAGHVSFQTSSSGKYGSKRHIVQVYFGGWSQAVGSPVTTTAAAMLACQQPLKFECDCGRHRFWFRYIATIGGWNLGRPETGFPKIRNPHLVGVACKHVLRVMTELAGAGVRGLLARAMNQERQRLAGVTKKTVLNVERTQAKNIVTAQQAKPRDVAKLAAKLQKALMGKTPAAAKRPMSRAALEVEAGATRARLMRLGMGPAQADQIAAAILATEVRQ